MRALPHQISGKLWRDCTTEFALEGREVLVLWLVMLHLFVGFFCLLAWRILTHSVLTIRKEGLDLPMIIFKAQSSAELTIISDVHVDMGRPSR